MKKLLSYMISAGVGLWIATMLVAGVVVKVHPDSNFFGISISAKWQLFVLFGVILGLLNYFVKPILNLITLPLRIVTLGLFGLVINMALISVVDAIFKELMVPFLFPLLWTALIIWGLNIIASKIINNKEEY